MVDLGKWLLANNHRPRVEGAWDCATMPGDWVIAAGYTDPIAKWRGWDTEEGAQAIIEEAGGLVPLFDEGLFSVGIGRRYGHAEVGDIAVLRIEGHEAGAIWTGQRFAIVAKRGIAYCSIDPDFVIAFWAVF